jgi:hypothetical protein
MSGLQIQDPHIKKPVPEIPLKVFTGEINAPLHQHQAPPTDPPPFEEILKNARVKGTEKYERPLTALSIVSGEQSFIYGTIGNFSLVKGKAKSKKTFLMCLLAATFEVGTILQGKFKSELPAEKLKVIIFDTEQSKYHVWKRIQAIAHLVGVYDLVHIEVYSLREYAPKDRCDIIQYKITELNQDKTIGLVIIDGIRDLIHDINDPKEATFIATKLLQWTTNSECHIIALLHENKGDKNPRGHVGTELLNKAETVVSVTVSDQDKAVSIVEAEMTRDKDFPSFAFRISESGIPEVIDDFEMSGTGAPIKAVFDPYHILPERHKEILRKTFAAKSEQSRMELRSGLQMAWESYSQRVGNSKADQLIAYYSQMDWIKNMGAVGRPAKYVLV